MRLLTLVAALLALAGVACVRPTPAPTPGPVGRATPVPEASPTTLPPAVTPTPTPPASPTPAATETPPPAPPPLLEVLSPPEGLESEVPAVRVLGRTDPDAAVAVNGRPVEPDANGLFRADLPLEEGVNLVEVVAVAPDGASAFVRRVVFYTGPGEGLPLSLFYPPDGLETEEGSVPVVGGTRPDAAVAVNGEPVEVNPLGLFSTTVRPEEGANLVEVVAVGPDGEVRSETRVVFRLP